MVLTGWSIASGVPPLAVPVRIVVTEIHGAEQTPTLLDYIETYRRARKCVKMHGRWMDGQVRCTRRVLVLRFVYPVDDPSHRHLNSQGRWTHSF